MRDTPATSVRPTVSDSMLKARRRNSDATRLSTPGLSSTKATSVCVMTLDGVRGGFHQHGRLRAANHRIEVGAGGHHRIHAVFLLDAKIDQHGAFRVACLLDDAFDARA